MYEFLPGECTVSSNGVDSGPWYGPSPRIHSDDPDIFTLVVTLLYLTCAVDL